MCKVKHVKTNYRYKKYGQRLGSVKAVGNVP